MTVELDIMMEMRDLQVARDVAQKFELGWFEVEFTMYGCCYLQDGKRYYRISADIEKIEDFIERSVLQDIYPSKVAKLSKKSVVPSGMKEYIAQDVQKELAFKLQEQFPNEFFYYLNEMAAQITNDNAKEILEDEKEQIAGCFDEMKLRMFQSLIDHAYSCRKITRQSYERFQTWLRDEYKDMEENPVCKDIFEKTFHGFAYIRDDRITYEINACKSSIYQKKRDLQEKDYLVTPIFTETYWYDHSMSVPEVRRRFVDLLRVMLNETYFNKFTSISKNEDMVLSENFMQYAQDIRRKFGIQAFETFLQYGRRWNLINKGNSEQ